MKLIGNIIYLIFGGFLNTLGWLFFGALLCVTIVGIPFGMQCFKAAKLSLSPFGKTVKLNYFEHPIANTIWCIVAGWSIALAAIVSGVALCLTIIFIPFALQTFKYAKLSFAPFGAKIY